MNVKVPTLARSLRLCLVIALIGSLLSFVATPAQAVPTSCAQGGVCNYGDIGPGGGKVFYRTESGFDCSADLSGNRTCYYLEAATTSSFPGWNDVQAGWGFGPEGIGVVGTLEQIGAGYQNTISILDQTGYSADTAAYIAHSYRGGGLTDWHLPSKNELLKLYDAQDAVGAFINWYYVSSTKAMLYAPWRVHFGNGDIGANNNDDTSEGLTVRPIRAFGESPPTGEDRVYWSAIDVPAPVRGATPVSTTETDLFTGNVTWSPVDNSFSAGTTYTATIELTPETGYTLEGVPANFFTVAGATSVTNDADSGLVTAVFPATANYYDPITGNGVEDCFPDGGTFTIEDNVVISSQYCAGLANIPEGVVSIGPDAFSYEAALLAVVIPDSVTTIGYQAFAYAGALTEVTIPDSVTSLGERAFQANSSLTSITIGSGVTSIAQYTFANPNSLNSLTIPDTVTSIGVDAFVGPPNGLIYEYCGPADLTLTGLPLPATDCVQPVISFTENVVDGVYHVRLGNDLSLLRTALLDVPDHILGEVTDNFDAARSLTTDDIDGLGDTNSCSGLEDNVSYTLEQNLVRAFECLSNPTGGEFEVNFKVYDNAGNVATRTLTFKSVPELAPVAISDGPIFKGSNTDIQVLTSYPYFFKSFGYVPGTFNAVKITYETGLTVAGIFESDEVLIDTGSTGLTIKNVYTTADNDIHVEFHETPMISPSSIQITVRDAAFITVNPGDVTNTLSIPVVCDGNYLPCSIGETGPGGGKIFYIETNPNGFSSLAPICATTGCTYLEAASNSYSDPWSDDTFEWSENQTVATDALGTAIGSGYTNSVLINNVLDGGIEGASSTALNYRGGGLEDWFLPSQAELNELCKYARSQTTGNPGEICTDGGSIIDGFDDYIYWSSSEITSSSAWSQDFENGLQMDTLKDAPLIAVRPIRAFGAVVAMTAPTVSVTPVTNATENTVRINGLFNPGGETDSEAYTVGNEGNVYFLLCEMSVPDDEECEWGAPIPAQTLVPNTLLTGQGDIAVYADLSDLSVDENFYKFKLVVEPEIGSEINSNGRNFVIRGVGSEFIDFFPAISDVAGGALVAMAVATFGQEPIEISNISIGDVSVIQLPTYNCEASVDYVGRGEFNEETGFCQKFSEIFFQTYFVAPALSENKLSLLENGVLAQNITFSYTSNGSSVTDFVILDRFQYTRNPNSNRECSAGIVATWDFLEMYASGTEVKRAGESTCGNLNLAMTNSEGFEDNETPLTLTDEGLVFDGTNWFGSYGKVPSTLQGDITYTIAAWIKNGQGGITAWGDFQGCGTSNNLSLLGEYNTTPSIANSWWDCDAVTDPIVGGLVGRHFVAATFDGEALKIYLDGQLLVNGISNSINSDSWDFLQGELLLGKALNPDEPAQSGIIEKLSIFNVALDAAQISELYSGPSKLGLSVLSAGHIRRSSFETQPQVAIQFADGSTAVNSTVEVTATIYSGETVVATATAIAANGVAEFTDLGFDGTVGQTYQIRYTSGDLTSVVQDITLQGTNCNGSDFTCQVGDTGPGGGLIFYHSEAGFSCGPTLASICTYLEVAASPDWNFPSDAWSGNTITLVGTTTAAIGAGYQNTLAIIAQSNGGDSASKAGTLSRAYRGPNNLDDWYLPSKNELYELFLAKSTLGDLYENFHWSSTEFDATRAHSQDLGDGTLGIWLKSFSSGGAGYIVPIRAFGTVAQAVSGAITGVTAPVTGATPVTTGITGTGFTGTVSWAPSVTSTFAPGTVYTATISLTPTAGYTLTGVAANSFTVAGTSSGATNAINSGEITAVFPATTTAVRTINVTAGANGAITPGTSTTIARTATPTYTITPATGYVIDTATVNTVDITSVLITVSGDTKSYTFAAGNENQTLAATFKLAPVTNYTITITPGDRGAVTPGTSTTIARNSTPTYTITPDVGYVIDIVTLNSVDITSSLVTVTGNIKSYTFTAVTSNQTFAVTFKVAPIVVKREEPISYLKIVTKPKVSRDSKSIFCQAGTYQFIRFGVTAEKPKLTSQAYSLLQSGAVVETIRSLESKATFALISSYFDSTMSCQVEIVQEYAVASVNSLDSELISKFTLAEKSEIKDANTRYQQDMRNAAAKKSNEYSRLLAIKSAAISAAKTSKEMSAASKAYQVGYVAATNLWRKEQNDAATRRDLAIAKAYRDRIYSLELAGVSVYLAAPKP
jgi:hypothetical protein